MEELSREKNIDLNTQLAPFRPDLVLHQGPMDFDGAPTFTLYDPISAHYFHLTWAEFQLFIRARRQQTLGSLMSALKSTTILLTAEEVIQFFNQARINKLLLVHQESDFLLKEVKAKKGSWWRSLLFQYLYFRISLVNPDKFLVNTRAYIRPFYTKAGLIFYGLAFIFSIYILLTRFSEYTNTFFYFFNIQGAIVYVMGILAVKCIHEFSHAYSASLLGIRVPAMGIAFIVLWPVLFTDVTDSWKLRSRRERFFIAFAGVGSELVLAAFCTIGWAITQPGILNSMFFVISSITWISSIIMNLNPAMRFDGYYMFSDWIGISNLQARAFALARWRLYRFFFGLEIEYPERHIAPLRENLLIIYAIYTMLYRLVLYVSIAVLVYFAFTKALGIILFFIEIVAFIGFPIAWEIRYIMKQKAHWRWNRKFAITVTLVALFCFWFVIPWKHTAYFPAIVIPKQEQIIYVPYDGQMTNIYVERGDVLSLGSPIAKVDSVELDAELTEAQLSKMVEEQRLTLAITDEQGQQSLREIEEKIAFFQKRIEQIKEKKSEAVVKADVEGTVYRLNDEMTAGQYAGKDMTIAAIATLNQMQVIAFVDEYFFEHLSPGDPVAFYYTEGTRKHVNGVIKSLDPQPAFQLLYPQMASVNGGDLPVHENQEEKKYRLAEARFTVIIHLNDSGEKLSIGQPGELSIKGPPRSKLIEWLRYGVQIFWRESGF